MTEYYCDSAAADDTGDGLSWGTAKKTIAATVAMESSGGHKLHLRGTHTIDTALTYSAAVWVIIGDSLPVIELDSLLSTNAAHQIIFDGVVLNVNIINGVNTNIFIGYNCTINFAVNWRKYYGTVRLWNCNLHGTPDNGNGTQYQRGEAWDCTFTGGGIQNDNGEDSTLLLVRCTFYKSLIDSASGPIVLDHCSIYDTYAWYCRSGYMHIRNCVVAEPTTKTNLPDDLAGGKNRIGIRDSYAYNATSDPTFATVALFDQDFTALTGQPFADPANGDWTPSAELAAIVGTDGLTPGAIHVPAAAGGSASPRHPLALTGRI